MSEYIIKQFIDISSATERRVWAIIIKAFFYLNCGIITIWLAEHVGYGIDSRYFDVSRWPSLLTQHQIIVPIFLFVFISVSIRKIIDLTTEISLWLFQRLSKYFLEPPTIKQYLIAAKVIDENSDPAENYPSALNQIKRRVRRIEDAIVIVEYYISLVMSIVFIYAAIVQRDFPKMYFWGVDLILRVHLVFLIFGVDLRFIIDKVECRPLTLCMNVFRQN